MGKSIISRSSDQAPAGPDTATVSDALAFLRRRRWLCIGVGGAILLGSILLAFKLPPVYMSQATILIEEPAIPEDIIPSTITSYVDEQIQIVAQRVYTPDSVSAIIEKFNLYPVERKTEPMTLTVERFIASTHLENLAAQVSDDRGRMSTSTFAFIVGFKHSSPEVSQEVTTELVQRFLAENQTIRTQRASTTTEFLEQQAKRLAEDISEMEVRLAEFKDQYGEALPDQRNLNVELLSRTEADLTDVSQELRQLRSEQQILLSQLQTIAPYATIYSESGEAIFSADQRLAVLRQQYLEYTSRYGPEHPDVLRTKREIEAIVGGGGGSAGSVGDVAQQRRTLEMERDRLLERYSPEHPDVVRLQKAIDALPEEGSTAARASAPAPPNNPAYLQAQARLEAVESGIAALEERRGTLTERRTRLERNIAMAPRVEQEWLQLNRGYASAQMEYEEIKRRSTGANLAERLEEQNKGERFTLLQRAGLPTVPIEPNRVALVFLGVVLALGGGIGIAAFVDALDSTIRSAEDLQTDFALKPVGTIPYIRTSQDRRLRWMRRTTATGVAIASVIVVATLT